MSSKKEQGVQQYYVSIDSPSQVKRELLEASKAVLVSLKNFEQLGNIRTQKASAIKLFGEQVSEARTTVNKVSKLLPKVAVPKSASIKQKVAEAKEESKVPSKPVPKTELQILEEELAAIESKLSSI